MRANVQTGPARTFWWDREPTTAADVLRAVIFDADSALADIERDGPRNGFTDLVMSLFVAGVWVGVVSTQRRALVETSVRHLIGDGLVETIVTVDDLADNPTGRAREAELYRLALWELGITPNDALAVIGSRRGVRAATAAGLPAIAVAAGRQFVGAAEVWSGYDDPTPLSAIDCQRAHRRWWLDRLAA